MSALWMLIRREYWEHRGSFLYIPLVMAILLFFVAACAALAYVLGFNIVQGASVIHIDQPTALVPFVFYGLGLPFLIVLACVMGHYFLGALFDDRKDKSILFWQSMPTSQTKILLAKLIAGLLLAPVLTLFCLMLTQVAFLLLGTLFLMKLHIEYWPLLWRPMPIIVMWWAQGIALLQQSLWLFPLAAWFLFCSALSRRTPLLRAIVPIVVVLILEGFFLSRPYFWHFLSNIGLQILAVWTNVMVLMRGYLVNNSYPASDPLNQMWHQPGLWVGLAIGVMLVMAAGWLRFRCYDHQ